MKIDKQKLIELLVEKTGMELEDVEEQLEQLITKIKEAAEKGKALEIKGFGMFYFSQKGDLKFDPSEDLETEVNHKYTGMEPVEIKKPAASTDEPVKEESEDTPPIGQETDKDDKKDLQPEKPEVEDNQEVIKSEDEESAESAADRPEKQKPTEDEIAEELSKSGKPKEEEFDPFAELDEDSGEKPEAVQDEDSGEKSEDLQDEDDLEKAKEREESIKSLFPELPDKEKEVKKEKYKTRETKAVESQPEKPETVREPSKEKAGKKEQPGKSSADKKSGIKSKSKSKTPQKKQRNPIIMITAAVIAALVLIVGIIVAMDMGVFGDSETSEEVAQVEMDPTGPAEDAETEPEETMEAEEETETTPDEPPADPEAEVPVEPGIEAEADETPLYGLMGESMDIDGQYYSIILHSIGSENRAREIQEQLYEDGYRAVITPVNTEEHGTMWRVGVGQFPTIPQAQEASQELPQTYRENNFIGLIQP